MNNLNEVHTEILKESVNFLNGFINKKEDFIKDPKYGLCNNLSLYLQQYYGGPNYGVWSGSAFDTAYFIFNVCARSWEDTVFNKDVPSSYFIPHNTAYGLYEGANLHYRVSFASHALYVIQQELSSRVEYRFSQKVH